ncbi:hypothetical protein EOA24_17795 [Mesorhizobium sp. M2A.F.Ca.ET.039.01.1.1]|nr:hypothetical protein EOA24_17795 [Mesorhizobium sp. M2A.F.Ca.ET.039.01.1.1]
MTNVSPAPAHLGIRPKGGLRHHYVQVGSSGPPIVFLHGFLDSWRSFQATFARLKRPRRLMTNAVHVEGVEAYLAVIGGLAIFFIELIEKTSSPVDLASAIRVLP